MPLVDLPAFSSSASNLREAALKLRTNSSSVTIQAPISESGVFASAILEAALLDAGIPYQRRLRDELVLPTGPSVLISESVVSKLADITNAPLRIEHSPVEVDALIASGGDTRRGVISAVALAGALAELISPKGALTRLLRPWALAGNWISDAMEHTYDPVYTVLRDYLSGEGLINVVTLPEVPDVDYQSLPLVDAVAAQAVRDRWGQLDLEGRAQAISHLLKPQLSSETPSTARLEELGWHRIMYTGWERDLASQISIFQDEWRNSSSKRSQANKAIDQLLKSGHLN
ncbi:MAG: hypothetical protein QF440_05460 [Candidatus Thalassarchaeaceae archaeon]|jgi:hypothetical protein|nr:hypothetical protein [Candidatus Thalassarchaeaceae archaeon]